MGPQAAARVLPARVPLAWKGAPGRAGSFLGFLEPRGASFFNDRPLESLLDKI